jgi:hypothetical protein
MNQLTRRTYLFAWLVLAGSAVLPAVQAAENPALVLYVDAVRGDDGNTGRSPQAALRTLSAAQAAMDKVQEDKNVVLLLARGSVWREAYEHKGPGRAPRYPAFTFGRPGLTIRATERGTSRRSAAMTCCRTTSSPVTIRKNTPTSGPSA